MIIYERFCIPVIPKTSFEGFLVIIVCIPILVGLVARLSASVQVY